MVSSYARKTLYRRANSVWQWPKGYRVDTGGEVFNSPKH